MELELGLKVTHSRDDLTSTSDIRVAKDPSGPIFVSKETETEFIIVGHFKGFRKENIGIEINEAGNRIAISGKKPVQEMVLIGWIMQRKEVEIRVFRKVFRIPDEVNLDKIKAKFNEEISNLIIVMPKKVKGSSGIGVEEVNEGDFDKGRPETAENATDKIPESQSESKENRQESHEPGRKEEIHHAVETKEPGTEQLVADEVAEKGGVEEAPQPEIVEEKKEENRDSDQALVQTIDQGQLQEAKSIPEESSERDKIGMTVKEKPEESKEKVGGESRILQNEDQAATEKLEESSIKESREPEVENWEENDQIVDKSPRRPQVELQATAEKVEPIPDTIRETATSEHKEEAERVNDRSQTKEPPETEETRKGELPEGKAPELGSERKAPGDQEPSTESGDIQVPKQSEFANEIEEKHTPSIDVRLESTKPEELQKQEPSTEVQELGKPEEPCRVHKPEKIPDPSKDEVHGKEETQRNEIKEAAAIQETSSQEKEDEHESQEFEIQKGLSEDAAQLKKHVHKKTKVCTPLVVAGSALLVSIIVFVIHVIRAKKR